ncbi:hypothetical protein CYMTET_22330 [Cymbomonas tetramitiformis]|uniref:Uncharacterized protein n=1 Tax=Cymbomonas tetramitiformis TaxID=36881 RepID=A0AAE0G0E5_9CHLO|nr:hypothetical protein CYMTET_22330 [Cymbomonas tetramitiformis]
METVMDTAAKLLKKVSQKPQLGPTATIPRQNATAVSAGVIRKTFLVASRVVLKATEALVADWDREDEVDMLSKDEGKDEEHDSPPPKKKEASQTCDIRAGAASYEAALVVSDITQAGESAGTRQESVPRRAARAVKKTYFSKRPAAFRLFTGTL